MQGGICKDIRQRKSNSLTKYHWMSLKVTSDSEEHLQKLNIIEFHLKLHPAHKSQIGRKKLSDAFPKDIRLRKMSTDSKYYRILFKTTSGSENEIQTLYEIICHLNLKVVKNGGPWSKKYRISLEILSASEKIF